MSKTTRSTATAVLMMAVMGGALAAPGGAEAQSLRDMLVQAPSLAAPQRGSLVGDLGSTTLGPGDVSRGSFQLPAPWKVPGERGPLLASVLPSYGTDGGLSEWGMGWRAEVSITRTRLLGELDYATDDLLSPWGRLVRGDDGAYYPVGLATKVRVRVDGGALVAYLPDGTRQVYGRRTRVDRARRAPTPGTSTTSRTWSAAGRRSPTSSTRAAGRSSRR